MMGAMISRGRVAVVLGRRGLSAILLAVAGLVFYMVFLAVLATEPSAQTDGNDTGDEGCPNPDQIDTFTGTENQITPANRRARIGKRSGEECKIPSEKAWFSRLR
jgi:hypothetical protein